MTLGEALLLGVVQGLTEFFPVSSSGHLVLAEALMGVNPPGLGFEVLVHLATLAAVLVLYGGRLFALARGTLRGEADSARYVGMLALASVPAAIAGLTLTEFVARTFDVPVLAAVMLLVTGCVVYAIRWLVPRAGRPDPGWPGAVAVGVMQAVALLPGISRSGMTVAAALGARTRPDRAAEFSFLLSVPAILGAAVLQLPELARSQLEAGPLELMAAAAAAFLAGLLAISLFVRWLRGGRFHLFAYYCWAVGGGYLLHALL
jgi:undecaprenyl-diphosphatase